MTFLTSLVDDTAVFLCNLGKKQMHRRFGKPCTTNGLELHILNDDGFSGGASLKGREM